MTWGVEKPALTFKYSLNRKEKRNPGFDMPIISDEWVETIAEEDSRYGKIFYTKNSYVRSRKRGVKFGARAGYVPPPEPPKEIEDQNSKKVTNIYYITSTHDRKSLLLRNVWARS